MNNQAKVAKLRGFEREFVIRGGIRILAYGLLIGAVLGLILSRGTLEVVTPVFTAGATLLLVSVTAELIEENRAARQEEKQRQQESLRRALLVEMLSMEATLEYLVTQESDRILLGALPFRTSVYNANLDQIGVLTPDEIEAIVRFYSVAENFQTQGATENKFAEERLDSGSLRDPLSKLRDAISRLRDNYRGDTDDLENNLDFESYHTDLVPPPLDGHLDED